MWATCSSSGSRISERGWKSPVLSYRGVSSEMPPLCLATVSSCFWLMVEEPQWVTLQGLERLSHLPFTCCGLHTNRSVALCTSFLPHPKVILFHKITGTQSLAPVVCSCHIRGKKRKKNLISKS